MPVSWFIDLCILFLYESFNLSRTNSDLEKNARMCSFGIFVISKPANYYFYIYQSVTQQSRYINFFSNYQS